MVDLTLASKVIWFDFVSGSKIEEFKWKLNKLSLSLPLDLPVLLCNRSTRTDPIYSYSSKQTFGRLEDDYLLSQRQNGQFLPRGFS